VDQRVTLVTLGVSDYARAKAFYAALGWRPALEVEETAFFQGNGVILALWGREKLGPDLGIPDDGARWSGMSLAQNVRSQEEVHAVIERARESGAQITREPSDTFYEGTPVPFGISMGMLGRSRTTQASGWTTTATSSFRRLAIRSATMNVEGPFL
jgi:catechol 2,3-dioxygenase-like lactoylglutathione lyase family enzyme